MGVVVVGVDIGQKYDPTAIAVVEPEWRKRDGREEDHWLIRHLERLPLGTPYPQVADRLEEVVGNVKKRRSEVREPLPWGGYEVRTVTPSVTIYVDATGVGQPVVDEMATRGLWVVAVYFTHGDKRTEEGWRTVKLGKAWLVSRMQTLLQGDAYTCQTPRRHMTLHGSFLSTRSGSPKTQTIGMVRSRSEPTTISLQPWASPYNRCRGGR